MISYEKRFVAFIDILGFKDIILKSVCPSAIISPSEIKRFLTYRKPVGRDQIILGRIGDISDSGHRMTTFSDSILITVQPTEQGLIHLLHHISLIGFELVRLKKLCRGGISLGLVYHDNEYAFGPGIIDAVELEKKAIYPRIILNHDVAGYGLSLNQPVDNIFKWFVLKDENDGWFFVNILRLLRLIMDAETEPPEDIKNLCSEMNDFLLFEIDNLSKEEENMGSEFEKITKKDKVKWFKNYFDWAIDRSILEIMKLPFPK